jgi:deoxyribodipyrimidine photo-lyase
MSHDTYVTLNIKNRYKMKSFRKTLFIFRRDLRLEDNTGLINALENSELVIPCFIFTPEQTEKNSLKNNHCLQFMIESLEDLETQLQEKSATLYKFYDHPEQIIAKCQKELGIDAVFVNKDYTPYSHQRDKKIFDLCHKHGIAFDTFDDALLNDPEQVRKKDGKPYSIFTPYFRYASTLPVKQPKPNRYFNYFKGEISFSESSEIYNRILPDKNKNNAVAGGRKEALKIFKILSSFGGYEETRNIPALKGTTYLSSYLKFTVVSIREVYQAICQQLSSEHELIRELYWRDFFTAIAYFYPEVFDKAFHVEFRKIKWTNNEQYFAAWCKGETGFPIVDAGMRELNTTGFMHNRVRMVVASFLTKDLHIDWKWGEHYFAKQLIDYDPAVNNGNWQWAASTGCDAQPYFRIFNPWTQQKKFDPDCIYIKKWIPELKSVVTKTIHEWNEEGTDLFGPKYPSPIIDHSIEAKVALKMYQDVR